MRNKANFAKRKLDKFTLYFNLFNKTSVNFSELEHFPSLGGAASIADNARNNYNILSNMVKIKFLFLRVILKSHWFSGEPKTYKRASVQLHVE
jgi:hypothetical protein